jgi:hypothetical protein
MTQRLHSHTDFGGNPRRRRRREDRWKGVERPGDFWGAADGSVRGIDSAALIAIADPACPAGATRRPKSSSTTWKLKATTSKSIGSTGKAIDRCANARPRLSTIRNRSGGPPDTFTTVYVDVFCPDHDDSGCQFGIEF